MISNVGGLEIEHLRMTARLEEVLSEKPELEVALKKSAVGKGPIEAEPLRE